MRTLSLFLILLAGCSRPVPTPAPAPALPAAATAPPRQRTFTARYQGHTAPEWAVLLNDADVQTSEAGAIALSQLGEDAIPFLLAGMKSPNLVARFHSVRCFPGALARKYADELAPLLKELLADRLPDTRSDAANLSAFLPEMRPALEEALTREVDPNIRKSIKLALDNPH